MTQPQHHERLNAFAEQQLSALSTRDICASTVHLILTTAFFTGAAIGLAKPLKASKKTYLASLRALLQNRFRLNADNAAGMIESNARLYQRYILIENTYATGLQAVQRWHNNSHTDHLELKNLLGLHRDLSMSGLNKEGVKQAKPAPVKEETPVTIEAPPPPVTPQPRRGRRLAWLLLLFLLSLAAALTQHLPNSIRAFLSP